MKLLASPLVAPFLAVAWTTVAAITIPNSDYAGPITAETTFKSGQLDGPKLSPRANLSSHDWWYFDVVPDNTSSIESVAITFFDASPYWARGPPSSVQNVSVLYAELTGTFKNGTSFGYAPDASDYVVIQDDGSGGISADWRGSGFSFRGSSLEAADAVYTISIDAPAIGVSGNVTLRSVAPVHYPCGRHLPDASEALAPGVWWASAQPDARASVRLDVAGTPMHFDGWGYHDKNWADGPLESVVQSWYWGHAHLGPYSLVWFDVRDRAGAEHVSAFVTRDGIPLLDSCAPGAVHVRPWGANDDYPPVQATETPQGFLARFAIGPDQVLVANITTQADVLDFRFYERLIGTVTGGIQGGETFHGGRALFEEFKFDL